MKNVIYVVRYKYQTNTEQLMTGSTSYRWNGFPEMLEIENELKKYLKKFKFKLIRIEDIQKIET